MKIYTRTGDDGSTGLLGPGRVPKSSPRVAAYGEVDELNSGLGVVRALDASMWCDRDLGEIQARLFRVGAELATTSPEALAKLARISDEDVAALERAIDRLDAELAPLTRFVLPGGTLLAAELHRARTVCRRAERALVALSRIERIEPRLIVYLNRLADLLFTMARWCNAKAGVPEAQWGG